MESENAGAERHESGGCASRLSSAGARGCGCATRRKGKTPKRQDAAGAHQHGQRFSAGGRECVWGKYQASAAPACDTTRSSNSETFSSQSPQELSQRAADGFLINGTANNGASSPFALAQAFGNNRRGTRSLYNGNIGLIFDNSALDARNFSITGQDTPKLSYDHLQGVLAFGGPFKIPHLLRDGGQFFVNYQWTRNRNSTLATGLVPTQAERNGVVPGLGTLTIVPQAQALLNLYPLPNFSGGTRYNYQAALLGNAHTDSLQGRYNKTIGRKNFFSALFALQSNRSDNSNLFGFLDTSRYFAINSNVNFRHNFSPRFFMNLGLQFNRYLGQVTPFFTNRENVSGNAGIEGNNQAPLNWGPPALNFASGITSLTDGFASHFRPQTTVVSMDNFWARSRHNISFGGGFPAATFRPVDAAGSARHLHVYRRGNRIRSGRFSSRGFPIPVPSRLATPTNIFAHRSSTPTSTMIGGSVPAYAERRNSLGILVADDGEVWTPGESGCGAGIYGRNAGLRDSHDGCLTAAR